MSWRDKPTLLKKINKETYYVFADESGDIKDLKNYIKKNIAGEQIRPSESTFIFTSVLVSPKSLMCLYAKFESIKDSYGLSGIPFHANDLDNRRNNYKNLSALDHQNLQIAIDEEMTCCRFIAQVSCIDKWKYIKTHNIQDLDLARFIIKKFYKKHFAAVNKMLESVGKTATFIIEESSDPKLDKIILESFCELKEKHSIKNIGALYFTNKSIKPYPSGVELADFVSNSLFKVFKHPKCYISLRKAFKPASSKYRDLMIFK